MLWNDFRDNLFGGEPRIRISHSRAHRLAAEPGVACPVDSPYDHFSSSHQRFTASDASSSMGGCPDLLMIAHEKFCHHTFQNP